jgi:hypothetical protein
VLADVQASATIAQRRAAYKSALVMVIAVPSPADCGGIAYQLDNADLYNYSAYGVNVQAAQYFDDEGFAHELGHNTGSAHDRVTDGQQNDTVRYNYAYVDPPLQWRTIMSYWQRCNNCPLIPYYSNVVARYLGQAMGIPAGSPGAADSARRLNEIIPYIAAYGSGTSTYTPETGWWWNPAESGRGYSIETRNGKVFMASFLYDSSTQSVWYATSATLAASSFSSTLDLYGNGQTLTGAYQAPQLIGQVGSVSLSLTSSTVGLLSLAGWQTSIQRFPIGGSSTTAPAAGMPETGWWWNSAESGRGFFFEVQGTTLFMAGYLYNSTGSAFWVTSSGAMTSTSLYQGMLTRCSGGQSIGGAYKAPSCVADQGSISIAFSSTTSATLTLPNGSLVPLTRYTF